MTNFSAAFFEHRPPRQAGVEMPEPLSPEEMLHMLGKEPPQGEYSVDAF